VVVGFFPAVSQTFVLSQIAGLLDRGHQVTIHAAGRQPEPEGGVQHPEVQRYRMPALVRYRPELSDARIRRLLRAFELATRHYWRDPRALGRVLSSLPHGGPGAALRLLYEGVPFVGQPPYDALLCHFGPNGERMLRLRDAGLVRGPIVTAFHGYDVSRTVADSGAGAYRRLFAGGDLFLPVSEYWRQRLLALGCPEERTVVHRMGIELANFPFTPRQPVPPGEPVRLLTVARLVEKKGVEYAIRAIAALRREMELPLRYQVIGEGPLRAHLEQLARELGVEDLVTLYGGGDQRLVARAMREAHLLLAPSVTASDGDMEGIPVALMEAMACGVPVVSTWHSGIPELVADGVSGVLVPEGDVMALAAAIRRLVLHPESWAAMGAAGRERVARGYDASTLNERLVELLSSVARGPRGASRATPFSASGQGGAEDSPKRMATRLVPH
jgi:colanic acid/amylovoran biosynthesis glycosyltransferase